MKSAVKKFKGLSDKAIAWIFIAPTLILLLAIHIYPLIYAIRMSFTNFYANKIGSEVKSVGLQNYKKILITMMPILPHLSNECFESIKNEDEKEKAYNLVLETTDAFKEFMEDDFLIKNDVVGYYRVKPPTIKYVNFFQEEKFEWKTIPSN